MDTVSDTDRIAAAEAYLDALVNHDANAVPFADDCVRIENGLKTGFSGNHLRRSANRGPQFRLLGAITDRSFRIDGDEVHATFTVVLKVKIAGRRVVAYTDETFLIPATDGKIHRIHARVRPALRREQT
ncbi:MAG: hypothetical protein ACM4D3_17505 [Candidatus Sericytochromatia bacterium]